jgi:hypothetical protein
MRGNSCVALLQQVEFDDAPQLAKADQSRRFDWWKHTKQLQHGSLLFLWWDGEPGGLPHMMFATVCDRKEQDLASRGERRRPQLGIRCVYKLRIYGFNNSNLTLQQKVPWQKEVAAALQHCMTMLVAPSPFLHCPLCGQLCRW